MLIKFIFVLSLIMQIYGQSTTVPDWWNFNHEHRSSVLKNYDKTVLPNHVGRNTTDVGLYFYPDSVDIRENEQTMVLKGFIVFYWKDDRLKYDYKDYGRLDRTQFSPDELWKPDIVLYNSAEVSTDYYSKTHLSAGPTGMVWWPTRAVYNSICFIDLTYWPYDEQACEIELGSWSTNGWMLDLHAHNTTLEDDFKNRHHWRILDISVEKKVFDYYSVPYPSVVIAFKLKRDSPSFTSSVAIPALAVALLMLTQFLLPVDHPQRVTVGCVTAVMVLMQLGMLATILPHLGTSVPLILRFYGFALFIVVVSIALSGAVIRLSHPQNEIFASPPPAFIKIILTSPVGFVLGLRNMASKIGHSYGVGEDCEVIDGNKPADYSHEWLFVATALDRITMLLFVTMYTLALFIFIAPVH